MEPVIALFIVIAGWVVLAFGPAYLRSRERMKLLDLVRFATERGESVPVNVIQAMPVEVQPQLSAVRDLRRGAFLLSIAVSIGLVAVCAFLAISQTEISENAAAVGLGVAAVGALPACIGIALIVLGLAGKPPREV